MSATDVAAVDARKRYMAGEKLTEAEQTALEAGFQAVGYPAWTKHQGKGKLSKEEEAWLDALVTERGREAKRKGHRKEPLTDEDRAFRNVYDRRQRLGRVANVYYPSPERKKEHEAAASEAGYSKFSDWVIAQLDLALHGNMVDPDYVQMLRDRIEELDGREKAAFNRSEEYRLRAESAEAKVQELNELFVELAERVVKGGSEKAAKWLKP